MPCWVISSGRGFFHDYWVIVLCTYHFVVMNEAFSFEKLFLRSGRKMTNLGEGENQKKVQGSNLFPGGLTSLSSEDQCLS